VTHSLCDQFDWCTGSHYRDHPWASQGALKWPFLHLFGGIFATKRNAPKLYIEVPFHPLLLPIYSFFIMAHSPHFSLPQIDLYIYTYFVVYLICPNQVWNRNIYHAPSLLKFPNFFYVLESHMWAPTYFLVGNSTIYFLFLDILIPSKSNKAFFSLRKVSF